MLEYIISINGEVFNLNFKDTKEAARWTRNKIETVKKLSNSKVKIMKRKFLTN